VLLKNVNNAARVAWLTAWAGEANIAEIAISAPNARAAGWRGGEKRCAADPPLCSSLGSPICHASCLHSEFILTAP
jgi:hypothetical protein